MKTRKLAADEIGRRIGYSEEDLKNLEIDNEKLREGYTLTRAHASVPETRERFRQHEGNADSGS